MKTFIKKMEPIYENYAISFLKNEEKIARASLSVRHFNELLLRLQKRFDKIIEFENELYSSEPDGPRPLTEIQADLLDAIESFFQGLYATLSSFANVVTSTGCHEYKKNIPIASMRRFLNFFREKLPHLAPQIDTLEKARDFRAKFVDHVQQHVLHDWMTYSHPREADVECVIIYFIAKSNNVYHRGVANFDPYDPNFMPPVDYESFYVSPSHKTTFAALPIFAEAIVRDIVETCTSKK